MQDLEALARDMKVYQDTGRQVEPVTSRFPALGVPDAYQVAELIHRARIGEGASPVGRKIGFTNPDIWPMFGVHEPIWGYIYDTTVVQLEDGRGTCALGGFAEPKIEPEIVLHFGSDPPPGGDLKDILNAVDWIAHGFEIVQSHFPGWKFRIEDTIVDSALHGALLVSTPQPVSSLGDSPLKTLESFSVVLACDGRERESGRGSNVLGSPLAAVAHLLSVLTQAGHPPLAAGEIVTTGTITAAWTVNPGEIWETVLRDIDLPGLTVEFTP